MNLPGGGPGDEADNPYQAPEAAMEPQPADGEGPRARWLLVEGYAALGTALAFFVLAIVRRVDHSGTVDLVVGLTGFGLTLLLGVSGVRSGRGGSRVAAGLALIVMVITVFIL